VIINFFRRRRINKFDDQLADGLVMASNGLRAGFSMLQAFDVVSKEARPPLSQEFELLLKEHRLGYELDEALRHLYERMPTTDTRIFVNSILILRETGGNLTEIFDTISETIQERKRVQKKIKTMTAEGKTQAVILAILPIALGFILGMMTPEVFSLMYTTFLGWILIILMALMEGAGFFWMLKIARVKI
jgi:tight adherence protein B